MVDSEKVKKVLCGLGIIVLVILFLHYFRWTEVAEVKGYAWNRVAQEIEWKYMRHTGARSYPASADWVESYSSTCGTIMVGKVPVPISCTKYNYTNWEWVETYQHETSGENHQPYWKELTLPESKKLVVGSETYWLILEQDGYELKTEVDFEFWQIVSEGDSMKVSKNLLNQVQVKGVSQESVYGPTATGFGRQIIFGLLSPFLLVSGVLAGISIMGRKRLFLSTSILVFVGYAVSYFVMGATGGEYFMLTFIASWLAYAVVKTGQILLKN